jgi:hypothetical protein
MEIVSRHNKGTSHIAVYSQGTEGFKSRISTSPAALTAIGIGTAATPGKMDCVKSRSPEARKSDKGMENKLHLVEWHMRE